MGRSNRHSTDHGVLAAIEVVAVPLAVLETTVVLALAGIAVAATRYVGSLAGAPGLVVDVLVWTVAVVAVGLLLSVPGMVVGEYRRFLAGPGRTLSPALLGLVPLVGVVGPSAYALYATGTLSLSAPLYVLVVLAAHALAARSIAWTSRRDRHRREGLGAGTLAGVPVTLVLVALVTRHLLGPLVDDAGQLLVGALGQTPLPVTGLVLVAYPVAIGGVYAAYRVAADRSVISPVSAPDAVERAPQLPNLLRSLRVRATPAVVRARDAALRKLSSAPVTASRGTGSSETRPVPTPPRSARSSGESSGSTPSGSDGASPVPRPPRSATTSRSDGTGSTDATDGDESRDATGGSASDDGGHDDPASEDRPGDAGEGGSDAVEAGSDAGEAGPDAVEGTGADSGADSPADESGQGGATDAGDADSGSDATDEAEATDDSSGTDEADALDQDGQAGDAGDGSDSAGTFRSDTQIFSASEGPDRGTGGSVETCPDCDVDLPSDGTFEFCPICGKEL